MRPPARAVSDPAAARQPADGARPGADRRLGHRRPADRDHGAGHRRGARGRLPGRGRQPRPQARRLLQRVLELPRRGGGRGPDRGPDRAAPARRDRGGGRGGLRPRHLRLGRPAHTAAAADPRRHAEAPRGVRLLAHDRRGGARVAVRHRGRQAARPEERRARSWSRSAAARTPSWRCAWRADLGKRIRGAGRGHARRPAGGSGPERWHREQAALDAFVKRAWRRREGRAARCARRRPCGPPSCARRAPPDWW